MPGSLLTEKGGLEKYDDLDISYTIFSKAVELRQPGEIWVGELCKEIRPPIDAIQPAPSGSGYGVLMLSWAEPYLDQQCCTTERSHMTHSILPRKTTF